MTKNTKEILFIKHALSMKKGVLLVGEIANLAHREDVVEFLGVMRQTDEGIFLCVPSPEFTEGIFVEGSSTGTLGKDPDVNLDGQRRGTLDDVTTSWVKVSRRPHNRGTQYDRPSLRSIESADTLDRKARQKGHG